VGPGAYVPDTLTIFDIGFIVFIYGTVLRGNPCDHSAETRTTEAGRGRRSCRHLTGARHASPGPGRWAGDRERSVVAVCRAEPGDPAGVGGAAAGLPWAVARHDLDHPGLAGQASPSGRGASQAQCGVGSDSRRPPAGSVPALRGCTVRLGLGPDGVPGSPGFMRMDSSLASGWGAGRARDVGGVANRADVFLDQVLQRDDPLGAPAGTHDTSEVAA
jgi:hypothetical protein